MGKWAIETRDKTTNLSGDLLADAGTPGLSGTTPGQWLDVSSWDKLSVTLIASATGAEFLVCVSNINPQSDGTVPPTPPSNSYDGAPWFVENFSSPVATQNSTSGLITFTGAGEVVIPVKIPVGWIKVKVVANSGVVSAPIHGV